MRTLSGVVKWCLDRVAAAALLLILSPLLVFAAVLVAAEDGGPGFFRQRRIGRKGRPFGLLKLRTMRVNRFRVEELGQVSSEHPLVTRTGRLLRGTKLDELPQLVNVLCASMSFVGPRPTVDEQVAKYDAFQRLRLKVRPGLTGLAQVCGNAELSWDERILLDVWYIDHWSLALDFLILCRTPRVIIRGPRRDEGWLARAKEHANRLDWRR